MSGNLWLFCSLLAAMLWGVSYTISQILLKQYGLNTGTIMMMTQVITMPIWVMIGLSSSKFGADWSTITASGWTVPLLVFLCAVTVVAGNHLTMFAISEKNATLASLVEISYPFFVALFGWFVFKEAQANIWTAFGGLLIFSGIAVIYLKS
jgi:drug/metabolite transporter (DMT)-like permease